MLLTFSTSVPQAASIPTQPAASALPAATMVFPANRRVSPAPQAQAILRLEAHLAPLVSLGPTVDPASQAAATAPQAHTALINAEVL